MLSQISGSSENLKSWHTSTVRAYYREVNYRMSCFLCVLDSADSNSVDSTIDLLDSFFRLEQAFFVLQDVIDGVDDTLQR